MNNSRRLLFTFVCFAATLHDIVAVPLQTGHSGILRRHREADLDPSVETETTASAVGEYLELSALCVTQGNTRRCTWAMNSTDSAPANYPYLADSLYYGPPGIAVFLTQLARGTNDLDEKSRWVSLAAAALNHTIYKLPALLASYGPNAGFYYGLMGISWGLRSASADLADQPGYMNYINAARVIEEHILSSVRPFASGKGLVLWNNTDVAHGAAGAGLALLSAAREEGRTEHGQRLRQAAVNAADWLLSVAERDPRDGSLRWWRGPDTDGSHETDDFFSTFCCGTAGVGYFLADMASDSENSSSDRARYLDAAQMAGEHLKRHLVWQDKTNTRLLLPHSDGMDAEDAVYYLGWCGGPPGWARLLYRLVQLDLANRDMWIRYMAGAVRALIVEFEGQHLSETGGMAAPG
eukprot:CAMPEP_0197843414 /NCGR_PEP_ID=MMETSP1438-20131217/285_1 /TAXON_ID=1461541 /ORGANISM="Pterosperma sp., Strain CCMP1384" /LENGTH=408 /DNA_ID=CAMNT_0043453541 /DNA_START=416 /DNA_END=1638 /DNA_ORIENTATION=-